MYLNRVIPIFWSLCVFKPCNTDILVPFCFLPRFRCSILYSGHFTTIVLFIAIKAPDSSKAFHVVIVLLSLLILFQDYGLRQYLGISQCFWFLISAYFSYTQSPYRTLAFMLKLYCFS